MRACACACACSDVLALLTDAGQTDAQQKNNGLSLGC